MAGESPAAVRLSESPETPIPLTSEAVSPSAIGPPEPAEVEVDPAPSPANPAHRSLAGTESTSEEVTLEFALWTDGSGQRHPLSDSSVLATILCGVDAERGKKSLIVRGGEETLEAVAPIYWPFLVLPAADAQRVALFDGTGVWRHSFDLTVLPPLSSIREVLARPRPPQEAGAWVRSLTNTLSSNSGVDTLVLEGCVPVELSLFDDILSEAAFRAEPRSAHAGFLPTRRSVERFVGSVEEIERSLRRCDADLGELRSLRQSLHETRLVSLRELEVERRRTQFEIGNRLRVSAYAEMDREVEALRHSLHDRVLAEIDRIRTATVAIAGARANAKLADQLGQRAAGRGAETGELRARARAASDAERAARRAIEESQQRIETLQTRERQAYQVLTDRLSLVEQRVAEDLAAFELVRADLEDACSDMDRAIAARIAQRTAERDRLAGQFVTAPALGGVRVVWLPIWVAVFNGKRGVRASVFPPMRLRPAGGAGDAVKTAFGGMLLPLEPRSARFNASLRWTIERALATDPWLFGVMRGLVGAADATAAPEFLQRLTSGLHELRQAGWLNADQEHRQFEAATEHLRSRPIGLGRPETEAGPAPIPSGTASA